MRKTHRRHRHNKVLKASKKSLERIEDHIDAILANKAHAEYVESGRKTTPWHEVKAEFGL